MTDVAPITPRPGGGQMIRSDPAAYASWPLPMRREYAAWMADAGELIPKGLWAQPGPGQPSRPSPAKVFLVFETGAMLDLHPIAALQGIDVIEGKATITPQLMTTLIRREGHPFRIRKSGSVTAGDYAVTVQYARKEDPEWISEETWDLRRAERAHLIRLEQDPRSGTWRVIATSSNGKELPWMLYPESLCVWRAIGVVGRENFDDCLKGIGYMPEELETALAPEGVREVGTPEEEAEYVARIEQLDDKADLAAIFHEINRAERWSDRIRAAFDAQVMKATKDSRPPKAGAPGQTGEATLDGEQPAATSEQPAAEPEQAAADDELADHDEQEAEVVEAQEETQEQIDDRVAREEAAEAERSRLEYEEWLAEQEDQA